jgi:hypothetical protein
VRTGEICAVWPGSGLDAPPGHVAVATYGQKLIEWSNLPVHTRGLRDGTASGPHSTGRLVPRRVRTSETRYLGKEGSFYLLRTLGIAVDAEVQTIYGDDPWARLVLPVAHTIPVRRLAQAAGLHPGHLPRILAGTAAARGPTRQRLAEAVAGIVAGELAALGLRTRPHVLPGEDIEPVLAAYLAWGQSRSTHECEGPGCNEPLTGRQRRYHSKRCEAAARRQRAREASADVR